MFILFLLLSFDVSESFRNRASLIPENITKFTTCDEFLEGTTFDESRLFDVDWKVFYMWALNYEEPYQVKYRRATPTLIERFKTVVDDNPPVNWNETAFFMESTLDLSALYIRTDTSGKYRIISSLIFEYNNVSLNIMIAMKIVEPGYLGFMNCQYPSCAALAPADKMPKKKELKDAAKLLKVNSPFGYPYNEREDILDINNQITDNNDDAEDEEELEVEMFGSSLQE